MNKELNDYIVLSRNNKISDEDIKNNLLSKGWDVKEVEEAFFILSGGDKNQLKSSLGQVEELKRKNLFASISLMLFFAGIACILFNTFVSLFLVFIGFVLGILGVKSNRKTQAIFGICLNFLMIVIIIINGFYNFYLLYYGKNIFSGKEVSDEEVYKMGYTADDLKEFRKK